MMTSETPVGEMRWKCVCAFDGRSFKGWQSQTGGGTVQDAIEAGLVKLFDRPVRIHGSSRTDAGVHARAMVFHFDADWKPAPIRLEAALRTLLPQSIRVSPVRLAPSGFHARYSAIGKRYCYYIYQGWADPFSLDYCWSIPRKLNVEAMERAAGVLQGKHDFTSFAALTGREVETLVRDVKRVAIRQKGRRIVLTFEANGFLYKMVRSMVGAMVNAGLGKLSPNKIEEILAERCRTELIETAPAKGLFLEKVFYSKKID